MYCPSCNSYNEDNGNFCSRCGAPLHAQQTPPPNPGYAPPQGDTYAPPQGGTYAPPESAYTPPQGGTYAPPQGGAYTPPNQQPYVSAMAEPTKPVTIATPVAALIVNLVFFNLLGLLLAVLSLLQYNNYTSEKLRGGLANAEIYKMKCKRHAKWAIAVAVIWLLVLVALGVAVGLLVFTRGTQAYPGPVTEFFVDPFMLIG